MSNQDFENAGKMQKAALQYALLLYSKIHPDATEDDFVNAMGGKDSYALTGFLFEGYFMLYHQALRNSLQNEGIDIGEFPDITTIPFGLSE